MSSRLGAGGEGSVALEEAGEPSFEVSEVKEPRSLRGPSPDIDRRGARRERWRAGSAHERAWGAPGTVTHAAARPSFDAMALTLRVRRLAFEVMAPSSLVREASQAASAASPMERAISPLDIQRGFALDTPTARLIWDRLELNEPSLKLDSPSPKLA